MDSLFTFFEIFCRVVIEVVFLTSFLGKIKSLSTFQSTITSFQLFPIKFSKGIAIFFLFGEFIVVLCMTIGGGLLKFGYFLAIALLISFSIALTTVLARKIQVSCNCFGSSLNKVTYYDVVRNAIFIVCAASGLTGLFLENHQTAVNLSELTIIILAGVFFVILITHLSEIIDLLNSKNKILS